MEERKPKLEIIVPHYKEPWRIGAKLFDMLDLQRGIEPGDFRVILVQDGEEGTLDNSHAKWRNYWVNPITIPHGGVSAARNAGIDAAKADWITFCDFDDMYTSVFSIKAALGAIKKAEKEDKVYLWNRFSEEGRDPDTGEYLIFRHDWDMTFIHGRFYKRQFLLDNQIRFNTKLTFGEDQDFNTIAQIVAGEDRVGEIREPIYLWCTNDESVTRREKDKSVFYPKMLEHRFATLEELRRRGIEDEYTAAVVRTTVDCYYEMNGPDVPENIRACRGQFAAWWKDHRCDFMMARRALVSSIIETVRRNAVERRGSLIEEITLGEWLRGLDQEIDG